MMMALVVDIAEAVVGIWGGNRVAEGGVYMPRGDELLGGGGESGNCT